MIYRVQDKKRAKYIGTNAYYIDGRGVLHIQEAYRYHVQSTDYIVCDSQEHLNRFIIEYGFTHSGKQYFEGDKIVVTFPSGSTYKTQIYFDDYWFYFKDEEDCMHPVCSLFSDGYRFKRVLSSIRTNQELLTQNEE